MIDFFKYTLCFLTSLCILNLIVSCAETQNSKKLSKPNLLFIFPDQLRNDAIGINKKDPVYTPNIDKIANEGMLLSNAISNAPVCSPYRGMLMTGKLPYNNSVISNCNSDSFKDKNSWRKEDVSFSDVLRKNGYDAGYIGKLHLTSPAPIEKDSLIWDAYTPTEERHGFNFWYAYGADNMHNKPHYWIGNAKENEVTYIDEWSAKHEADVLIDYLKNTDGKSRDSKKPFALFWSVNPPHPPYQYVPEKYVQAYKDKSTAQLLTKKNVLLGDDAEELAFHTEATRNRTDLAKNQIKEYFAMVTGVDDQIGRVMRTLKEQGLHKNTIVVITSDHGEMMASHALMSKNIWFDEAINVPFIIRWPEKIKAGQRENFFLSSPDIMPTLLNMMGTTEGMPKDLDGRDLSSLITQGKGEKPDHALYYYLVPGHKEEGFRGIKTHNYTYVITVDQNKKERKFLYDNKNDPEQMNNIIGKGSPVQETLHTELMNSLKENNDPWLNYYNSLYKKQAL